MDEKLNVRVTGEILLEDGARLRVDAEGNALQLACPGCGRWHRFGAVSALDVILLNCDCGTSERYNVTGFLPTAECETVERFESEVEGEHPLIVAKAINPKFLRRRIERGEEIRRSDVQPYHIDPRESGYGKVCHELWEAWKENEVVVTPERYEEIQEIVRSRRAKNHQLSAKEKRRKRLETASGRELDAIAKTIATQRRRGETDREFRCRLSPDPIGGQRIDGAAPKYGSSARKYLSNDAQSVSPPTKTIVEKITAKAREEGLRDVEVEETSPGCFSVSAKAPFVADELRITIGGEEFDADELSISKKAIESGKPDRDGDIISGVDLAKGPDRTVRGSISLDSVFDSKRVRRQAGSQISRTPYSVGDVLAELDRAFGSEPFEAFINRSECGGTHFEVGGELYSISVWYDRGSYDSYSGWCSEVRTYGRTEPLLSQATLPEAIEGIRSYLERIGVSLVESAGEEPMPWCSRCDSNPCECEPNVRHVGTGDLGEPGTGGHR